MSVNIASAVSAVDRKPQQIRRGWNALGWNRPRLTCHFGCDEVVPHDEFLVATAGEAEIKSLGSGGILRCGGLGLCFDALQGADDLDTGGGTPMRRAAGAQQSGQGTARAGAKSRNGHRCCAPQVAHRRRFSSYSRANQYSACSPWLSNRRSPTIHSKASSVAHRRDSLLQRVLGGFRSLDAKLRLGPARGSSAVLRPQPIHVPFTESTVTSGFQMTEFDSEGAGASCASA